MKNFFKKFLSFGTALIMSLTVSINTFGSTVTDLNGHWAKSTIESLITDGIISGYSDGTIKPDNLITRAEFMSAVNKAFGFSAKADVNFSDLKPTDWYYDTVRTSVKAGYLSGYSDGTIKASNYITKQEAVFIICKIKGYDLDSSYADKFTDGGLIDSWVKGSIGALAKRGIISGYSDGSFKAKNNITRAEAFTILNKSRSTSTKATSSIVPVPNTSKPTTSNNSNNSANKYDGYTLPTEVNSYDEWKTAILYCIDMLYDSVEIKINGFDKGVYQLDTLGLNAVNVKAEGSIKNGVATVKYTFDYKSNFKLLRTAQDTALNSKLNAKEQSTLDYFKSINSSILSDTMTDYDKELAIHNFIINNYTYAGNTNSDNLEYYDVTSVISSKIAYCEAYAYSFAIMGTLAGLDVDMMFGTSDGVNHAWNIIKLDDEYYHVDTTFDDGAESYGQIIYNYFNLTDSEISKNHSWTSVANKNVSANGTKYNYFNYNNLIADDYNKLSNIIITAINNNKETIHFKTTTLPVSQKNISDILDMVGDKISKFSIIGNLDDIGVFTLKLTYK